MSLFDKAKEAAQGAADKAKEAADKAKDAAEKAKEKSLELVSDDKIADAIISALTKQEKVNEILAAKGSKYCIGEISVELGLPPSISFTIVRK